MDMGRYLVERHLLEGTPIGQLAREHGVHRSWLYKRLARYRAEGEAGLELRSRRPRRSPSQISDLFEDEIVALRKELAGRGWDAGPQTIHYHLSRRHRTVPSVSTIWRVLKARGFVVEEPHKRPKSSFVRFVARLPNELWQMDVTHVALGDDRLVELLNVIDDHSRLCVAAKVLAVVKAPDVVRELGNAGQKWGLPASVLSDNGAVFTAAYRNGIGAVESALAAHGIEAKHSRPYHPQTCGKVERFHQTVKKYLAMQDPVTTIRGLQGQVDRFVDYYNAVRPHRALGRKTPLSAFRARTKAKPRRTPIDIGERRRRRDVVDRFGKVTLRYQGRLRHIGLGARYAGRTVTLLVDGPRVRVVGRDGRLIRQLVIDPTRNYQPQA